jgi:hypothetical protein
MGIGSRNRRGAEPSAWPLRWLLVLLAVLIVFLLNARVGLP